MNKDKLVKNLEDIEKSVKTIRTKVKKIKMTHTANTEIQQLAKNAATCWYNAKSELPSYGIQDATITSYEKQFQRFTTLASGNSRVKSYLDAIGKIIPNLKKEIILPVISTSTKTSGIKALDEILKIVTTVEKEYLEEAKKCESFDCDRASVILGWCSVAYRMHKTIEKDGFTNYNQATTKMKNTKKGIYKDFNNERTIQTIGELQRIPDSEILKVLEFNGFLDATMYKTLDGCLGRRNNAGHPGDAVISKPNLESFFADIQTNIFENVKFKI